MEKFILFLVVLLFVACVSSVESGLVKTYPDPDCPHGYTWTVRPGTAAEQGACLLDGWKLTEDCLSFRDLYSRYPPYAFWSCVGEFGPKKVDIRVIPRDATVGSSFIPGAKVVACDLYDMNGDFVERIWIMEKDQEKSYCDPRASFVLCVNENGQRVLPKDIDVSSLACTGKESSAEDRAPPEKCCYCREDKRWIGVDGRPVSFKGKPIFCEPSDFDLNEKE